MGNKVLILGGAGMLGHKTYQTLMKDFDVSVTFRNYNDALKRTQIFDSGKVIDQIDVFKIDRIRNLITDLHPDHVINCIGIIKQKNEISNPKIAIYINSLFPHLLAEICETISARLIQITTDCVFSGEKGTYLEKDIPDAEDIYGKTKYLGELNYKNSLTLRTSIVGRELFSKNGLVEWFISQDGKKVHGYTRAIYTGLTTLALSREMGRILKEKPGLSGLYHVSSDKINKFELLTIIKKIFKLNISIEPDSSFKCDRSLDSGKYKAITRFIPQSWESMVEEMHQDPTDYNLWKTR